MRVDYSNSIVAFCWLMVRSPRFDIWYQNATECHIKLNFSMIPDWRCSVPFSKGPTCTIFVSAIADTTPGFIRMSEVFLVHGLEHGLDFKQSE